MDIIKVSGLPVAVFQVTGIPVDTSSVIREKHTNTQTRKSIYERWENVEGIFKLRHPERLVGKHILIVDDVLTTGATTTACADVFREIGGIRYQCIDIGGCGSLMKITKLMKTKRFANNDESFLLFLIGLETKEPSD